MKISRDDKGQVVVLRLQGKLMGGPDAGSFRTAVMDAIEEGRRHVLVDLSDVSLANSTGLGILVTNHATLKRNEGVMKLLNVPARIASSLQTTFLDRVFETYKDEAEALASFGS